MTNDRRVSEARERLLGRNRADEACDDQSAERYQIVRPEVPDWRNGQRDQQTTGGSAQ
jgi:hypothetical protein